MESAEQYQVKYKDISEDSIEKCWIPRWNEVKRYNLSVDQATLFCTIGLMEESKAKEVVDSFLDQKDFGMQFINKAMQARFDIKLTYKLQLWLAATFVSPGVAVMIFAYMKYKLHECNISKDTISFGDFAEYIFPIGYPNTEEFDWLWHCQKIVADEDDYPLRGSDNLLDYAVAYKSFC